MIQLRRVWSAFTDGVRVFRGQEALALFLVTLILVTRYSIETPAAARWLAPMWSALDAIHPLLSTPLLRRQIAAVVLQLVLPVLFIWLVHRGRLKDYGLGIGDHRFWIPITAAVFLIQVIVVVFYLSRDPTYLRAYPSLREARQGGGVFWFWESTRVFYMLSWEFLFRGYLLFALARKLGLLSSVVQTVPFTLMHIVTRKPVSEIYFTIFSGFFSGLLAHESRSVLPVVWLHAAGAILLDICIVYLRT